MKSKKPSTDRSGFTLVELIIVIVVIAVLASITIFLYNGLTARAKTVSLASDLSGNSKKLALYREVNGSYPTTNDCSGGSDPQPPSICLIASQGNIITGYSADNTSAAPTYKLTMANGSLTYAVTDNSSPAQVTVASVTVNGGVMTTSGADTIYTFNGNGTFSITGGTLSNVSALVIGGGGGGGIPNGKGGSYSGEAGGGGGGQFLELSGLTLSGSNTVTVGSGGALNTNGGNSIFGPNTAIGGGGGGNSDGVGKNGASGGGGGEAGRAGGAGLAGYNGGDGGPHGFCGGLPGSGGGAGAVGDRGGGCTAGSGGIGKSSTISGNTMWYGGGGSAEGRSPSGGGGNGDTHWGPMHGLPNTGGGGGTNNIGGSGVVIVRYPTP